MKMQRTVRGGVNTLAGVVAVLAALLIPSGLWAEEAIEQISLGDLLNLKITTAGKTEQKVSDIPASVIVITKDEIQRYGYKDVSDIMKHIPGLYSTDLGAGENFGVRGFMSSTNCRNLVILINGMEIRNAYLDENFIASINIPVESIDRVEFVRGPMSVMYGNGAFFGALNIITKNSATAYSNTVAVTGGLENTARLTASSAGQNGDFEYAFNGSYYRTDGREFDFSKLVDSLPMLDGTFTRTAKTTDRFAQRLAYFDLSGQFKDFYAGLIYSKSDFGVVATTIPIADLKQTLLNDLYKLHFGYRKAFSDKFTLDTHFGITSDAYTTKNLKLVVVMPTMTLITNPYIFFANSATWLGEITTFIKPVQGMDMTLGYLYQNSYRMDIFMHLPEFGANGVNRYLDKPIITHSPYAKIGYWAMDNLLFEAGARFEQRQKYDQVTEQRDATNVYTTTSTTFGDGKWNTPYNFAALFKFNDAHNVKAVYGKAINFPTPMEFASNVDVKPQDIQSAELIYTGLYFSKLSVSVSGFYNNLNNLLMVNIDDQGTAKIGNSGKMETTGGELMLTYKPNTKFELSGSVMYQQTDDQSYADEIDAGISPNWLATLKSSYQINPNITVGLTGQYVSDMEAVWDPATNTRAGNTVDGYFNVGANFRMENIPLQNLFLDIRGTNLLGTDIYSANGYTNLWYQNGMLGQGRYVQATIGYEF